MVVEKKQGVIVNGYGISFGDDENILKFINDDGCITVTILKTNELYILNGWIVRYVSHISIKLLQKNYYNNRS